MSRLVVVSNRIVIPGQSAAPGGLAVGILAALRLAKGIWFGWSGNTSERAASDPHVAEQDGIRFVSIDLPRDQFGPYYDGFCNSTLWPLHHYFPGTFRYDAAEYQAYLAVNRTFAAALDPLIQSHDRIWVHDYHLIPLAALLRRRGIRARLGFFLHIPYPNIAMLRVLPVYAELVRDLCEYDLVGFQTDEDLDAFHSAVRAVYSDQACIRRDWIELSGRRVQTGVFPIGVEVDTIQEEAVAATQEDDQVRRLVAGLLGRKLLLGVDRLDYSKGLVQRFAAYRTLLESTPTLLGKVTYIQVAPLSRTNVAAYAEIRDALEQAAGHTNGQFSDPDWTPLRYLNRDLPHPTLMAFLRAANVAVVTPLRDGMNLVSKEFVAAQDPENPGVLVLSGMAGSARELTDALLVNPYDRNAVATALRNALAMPIEERRARHLAMMKRLRANSLAHWHSSFVARLES
jgi:trehalose 6-phosphate synthase